MQQQQPAAAAAAAMAASEDREVEEKLARMLARRTELERKSRSALQSMAKNAHGAYGIAANLKSSVMIDKILLIEFDYHLAECLQFEKLPYDSTTYMETMEAVRLWMKKSEFGAKCILDCVMQVEAELRVKLNVKPSRRCQGCSG